MKSIISIISTVILSLVILPVYAQFPGGGNRGGGQNMNMGHFYGKIVDAATNKGVDAASVQLFQSKFDSTTKKRKDVSVAGMLTSKKGEFSLENLSVMGKFTLKITAIGYKSIEQKVGFEVNMGAAKNGDMSSMLSAIDKDLGNIKISVNTELLQTVTVTASKSLLTMSIDRKIYNVEKDINSSGGTAIDVMKNVPSENADIDGNVTMRNASPQIFVDGRPTTMSLDQIPADAIATVEIITNPSAKFDASGGGAGILNIVMKKNRKTGYNGNIRSSIDSRGKPGFGGDINIRQQKINLFASGQVGFRKTISSVSTNRTDYVKDTINAHTFQSNGPVGNGVFGFGKLGFDYFIDNRNTITLSGNMSRGRFKNNDMLDVNRDTVFNTIDPVYDFGARSTKSTSNNQNYGTSLSFKHNFAKANKELTADVNYNYNKNNSNSDFITQYYNISKLPKTPLQFERTAGGGTTNFLTVQTDYSNPIKDKMKIETGARVALRKFNSFNDNFVRDPSSGIYITQPQLNNKYKFTDRVLAAYVTFSHQIKKFSYNVGLRVESSKYDGTLINKNQSFSNEYPFSLFPSAFATYKLSDIQDIQVNYSRKINRPNFFQLIPFYDYTDSLNISVGNPGLVPEFTNLIEVSHQAQFNKKHSLLSTLYFKNTNNQITRNQYRDKSPIKADTVLFTSYANANRSYTYGLEITAKDKITKWWDITTNINLFQSTIKAGNITGGNNTSQFSWFAKLNNSFKLPKSFSIQLSANYQAKTLLSQSGGGGNFRGGGGGMFFGGGNIPSAQGYIKPFGEVEIAIKKEFLKNNAASVTLQVSDIFRTRVNATHSESVYFVQDYARLRDPQVFRLSFNWKFGKVDVSLFKRKNMRGDSENMQNSMQSAGGQ